MYIMPSGMIPEPVGVSVAIRKRSNWSASRTMSPRSSVVRRLPAVHTCSAMFDSCTRRGKSSSGMATGPPFTWNDTSGLILMRWSAQMPEDPGIDEPPVCTIEIMPCFLAHAIMGS